MCRFPCADSIIRRILLCGSIEQTPLCGFHRVNSTMQILACRFLLCGFLYAHFIPSIERNRIPSTAFHRPHSIHRIPSSVFRQRHFIVQMRIPSCGFYCVDLIVRILLCGFHRADSIMQIPSFDHFYSVVCIPSCGRRRKEVKEDEGWVHWRIVFTLVTTIRASKTE